MNTKVLHLLLADDDETDRELFEEALKVVPHEAVLHKTTNGEQLMDYLLQESMSMPDALFLDINMPRKNGMECLAEIKCSASLSDIPVFIVSTSMDPDVVRQVYEQGACGYVRKPGSFKALIATIRHACDLVVAGACDKPPFEHFVLNEKV
ncbi:MAG: response regulator [Bacteroidetes bacterium]|nr:response regulator [Bacteroidota bacterium]MBS1685098.1 response regulator [Bacteroidota bacterium]